jgi:hypothetical protein
MVYHSIAIEVKFLQCTESIVKDRGGDRRGGVNGSLIKFFHKNLTYVPRSKPQAKIPEIK